MKKMISNIDPKLILLVVGLFALQNLNYAQGWERVYENDVNPPQGYSYASANNIYELANGTFQVFTQTDNVNVLRLLDNQGYQITSTSMPRPKGHKTSDDFFIDGWRLPSSGPPEADVAVSKFDEVGNTLWTYTFGNAGWNESLTDLIQDNNGDYIISGGSSSAAGGYILKFNENGDELWKTYTNINPNIYFYKITALSDGGYLAGCSGQWTTSTLNTFLIKLDIDGNILWEIQPTQNLSDITTVLPQTDGFITFGTSINNQNSWTSKGIVTKYNLNGDVQWSTEINNVETQYARKLIPTSDGGFAALMYGQVQNSSEGTQFLLSKLDANGNQEWFQEYGLSALDYPNDIQQTMDGGFIICGEAADGMENADIYVVKTDANGISVSNSINGNVFYDLNLNCLPDNGDDNLEGWIVSAAGNQVTYYGYTDIDGNYQIDVDQGSFEVRATMPSPYWEPCVDSTIVVLDTVFDTATVDIPVQSIEQCAYMVVGMHGLDVRICEENTITVVCENIGTELAEDVTVDITFDDFYQFVDVGGSATVVGQNNNTYTFGIGDVDYLESISFNVTLQHDCDTTLIGQTFCAEAHIYPDETCLPISPFWSGAELSLRAECIDDEVIMTIENVGTGDMTAGSTFTVVEDHVIMLTQPFDPILSGASITIPRAANGSFQRIETNQVPFHPIGNMPVAFVEGCGENSNGEISTGFVNQYALGDGAPFEDILCLEVVAAYDPNEKIAFPMGYQEEHFIEKNTELTYALHFQNIGTAAANRVVVTDELSEHLDPTTIELGASSHPYTFRMFGQGIMEFTFDNIMLPDSASNQLGSQGFVQFKIQQKENVPLGTQIFNEANIYFDILAAIRTNQTIHTIGENFITVHVDEITIPNVAVNVFPNPFTTTATFEISTGIDFYTKNLTFELIDVLGRKVFSEEFSDGTYILNRGNLDSGSYFYTIRKADEIINSGKVMFQKF